ncbi:M48 family metallopeptidase [Neochlamydia sp. S13]|uniref:M48 family metallopeptidase n=1 Tax=Neochlamydia sp. S13 TaxID=1353976 RepID=UPI000AC8F3A8|nr:M48 family metallopeptidase [Neochlamydia sp. S13]BBI17075.1 Protease HtpX homolog [Neochlamydia sp. S13]
MAINFWEAQKKARSKTKLYLGLFLALTLLTSTLVEYTMRDLAKDSYHPPIPLLGGAFLIITCGIALVEYSHYKLQGGAYVARSLGARLIDDHTNNLKEKQLLNIVQEIAIASSLPVPPVYILPTDAINAFTAGLTPENAAIAITKGSLDKLTREELQGVIAHEFGHIYNGDIKISMRLAAMVMGFFYALYIGMRLLQFTSQSRERRKKKENNPVVIAALLIFVAGALTWIMGSILKAAVSREREYLADACAVQFTRNSAGIIQALIKIERAEDETMPLKGMAYSHLYFNDRMSLSSLFSTHPPIRKRIVALEGGEYIPIEWRHAKILDH